MITMDFKLEDSCSEYYLVIDGEIIVKISKEFVTAEEMNQLFDKFSKIFEAGALFGFQLKGLSGGGDVALDMLRVGKALHIDAVSRGMEVSGKYVGS